MKSESIEHKYRMNANTTVVIKSKKMKDADVYINTVQLIHETSSVEPIKLRNRSDIQEYLNGVDLDDYQVSMFNTEDKGKVVVRKDLE